MLLNASNNQPVADVKNGSDSLVASAFVSKQAADSLTYTKVPWMPTVVQGVVQDLKDGVSSLVLLLELPANIINTALLTIKITADGKFLEVFRPRGKILSDVGYVAKAMEHDNGATIPTRKVNLFVGVLEKALWDLRDKKKSGMIIDYAKIPLQEQVNVAKKMTTKLVGANDNTSAMLIVLQTLSSEEVVSDEEVHTDLFKVHSPLNSKKRASC